MCATVPAESTVWPDRGKDKEERRARQVRLMNVVGCSIECIKIRHLWSPKSPIIAKESSMSCPADGSVLKASIPSKAEQRGGERREGVKVRGEKRREKRSEEGRRGVKCPQNKKRGWSSVLHQEWFLSQYFMVYLMRCNRMHYGVSCHGVWVNGRFEEHLIHRLGNPWRNRHIDSSK